MEKVEFETLVFIRDAAKTAYRRERGDLLFHLDNSETRKANYEAANPGKEHGFKWEIDGFKFQLEKLDRNYSATVEWLKSQDSLDILF